MPRAFLVCFVALLPLAAAQDVNGAFSFFDLDPAPLDKVPACIEQAPDRVGMLECFTNTEITDVPAFAECESKAVCERYAYPVALFPEKLGLIVEEVYAQLWERYLIDVTLYASEAYQRGCNPASTAVETILYAETTALGRYWAEVMTASFYYLSAALWFNNPFPGFGPIPDQGAVVLPSFSLFPDPEQYVELTTSSGDPRDLPYYFGPPAFANLPVPYQTSELAGTWPGLYDKEVRKYALDPATLLEYNQFGHTSFFSAHGEQQPTAVIAVAACYIPVLPVVIPLVPRALSSWDSVPEGYPLLHVEDDPFVPLPEAALVPASLLDVASAAQEVMGLLELVNQGNIGSLSGNLYFSLNPFEDVINCPPVTINPAAGANPLPILEVTPEFVVRGPHTNETTLLLFLEQLGDFGPKGLVRPEKAAALPNLLEETGATSVGATATQDLFFRDPLCEGDEGPKVLSLKALLLAQGFATSPLDKFDADTDKAVRSFQLSRGLEPDGIVNPPTWAALLAGTVFDNEGVLPGTPLPGGDDPSTPSSPDPGTSDPGTPAETPSDSANSPIPGVPGGGVSDGTPGEAAPDEPVPPELLPTPEAAQVAQQVLANPNVTLWPYTPVDTETSDGSDAQSNVAATAALQPAKRSGVRGLPGGNVPLNAEMLGGILAVAEEHTVRVLHVAGGDHPSYSPHAKGLAFTVDAIDGVLVGEVSDAEVLTEVMGSCQLAGALIAYGPTNDPVNHAEQITCVWPDVNLQEAQTSP